MSSATRSSCPWCVGARVRERRDELIVADLIIGFSMFRERFTSRVTLSPPHRIDVAYTEGPFKYLNNHWIFERVPGGCRDRLLCRFRIPLADLAARHRDCCFNEAVRRMVAAFEDRARQLYGAPEPHPAGKPAV